MPPTPPPSQMPQPPFASNTSAPPTNSTHPQPPPGPPPNNPNPKATSSPSSTSPPTHPEIQLQLEQSHLFQTRLTRIQNTLHQSLTDLQNSTSQCENLMRLLRRENPGLRSIVQDLRESGHALNNLVARVSSVQAIWDIGESEKRISALQSISEIGRLVGTSVDNGDEVLSRASAMRGTVIWVLGEEMKGLERWNEVLVGENEKIRRENRQWRRVVKGVNEKGIDKIDKEEFDRLVADNWRLRKGIEGLKTKKEEVSNKSGDSIVERVGRLSWGRWKGDKQATVEDYVESPESGASSESKENERARSQEEGRAFKNGGTHVRFESIEEAEMVKGKGNDVDADGGETSGL